MALVDPAAIRNAYNTLTGGQTSRQVIDMADKIDQLYPTKMPFIVLLNRGLGKRNAHNWKIEWFTDDPFPHIDTTNGSLGIGATSIVVDNGNYWLANDVILDLANFDVARITSVATNTLTVVWATTPTAGIADGTEIVNIGSAWESGSTYGTPRSTKEVADYNYVQILREPMGMTEIQRGTKMYGGADWAYQAKKKGAEHARKLERLAWWGERKYETGGTNPYGMMRGLHQNITTNVNASFGAVTQAKLDAFLQSCREGDISMDSKMFMFTDLTVKSYISHLANTKERVRTGATVFGINVATYESPALDHPLTIISHPEFSLTTGLDKVAYIVQFHTDRLKRGIFSNNGVNLDTHIRPNVQNPGYTSRVDEWYSTQTMVVKREAMHGRLGGISDAA